MTAVEAKEVIKEEFMERYKEWLKDIAELNDHDFGWKYGWQKSERTRLALKDNLNGVVQFQKYFYPIRKAESFKALGIEKEVIWELVKEGWLSEKIGYWKNPSRYFVRQEIAKQIWKEAAALANEKNIEKF